MLLMIAGFLLGGIMYIIDNNELKYVKFDPTFFFYKLLPPIIFHAGYTINITRFLRYLQPVGLLSIVGVIISTAVIGIGVMQICEKDLSLSTILYTKDIRPYIAFGALLSSLDPITVLSLFEDSIVSISNIEEYYNNNNSREIDTNSIDINQSLQIYSILSGESVLNDISAIAIYHSVIVSMNIEFTIKTLLNIFYSLIKDIILSILLGFCIGILSYGILKKNPLKKLPQYEMLFQQITSYACYCLCELFSISSITSLFVCGIIHSKYTSTAISDKSKKMTHFISNSLSTLCENFLFLYLGTATFLSLPIGGSIAYEWNFMLIFVTFFLCIIGRIVHVIPIIMISNYFSSIYTIDWRSIIVIALAGQRGAVSFALVLRMESTFGIGGINESSTYTSSLITTTISIIILSIGILGSGQYPILYTLGIIVPRNQQQNRYSSTDSFTPMHSAGDAEQVSQNTTVVSASNTVYITK